MIKRVLNKGWKAINELSVIVSTILPMMYLSSLKPKEIML